MHGVCSTTAQPLGALGAVRWACSTALAAGHCSAHRPAAACSGLLPRAASSPDPCHPALPSFFPSPPRSRFQQVYVDQPSVTDTISILRGLRER